jgi:hypothetical protein
MRNIGTNSLGVGGRSIVKRNSQTQVLPERFLPYRKRLLELCISNRAFQELWEDYCELTNSLRAAEDMHRLQNDLETEILEALLPQNLSK